MSLQETQHRIELASAPYGPAHGCKRILPAFNREVDHPGAAVVKVNIRVVLAAKAANQAIEFGDGDQLDPK